MTVTYWRNPATGLIEGISEDGKTTVVQKSLDLTFDAMTKAGFRETIRPDGTAVWVQEGIDVPTTREWRYNPALGGAIAGEIANGGKISKLHKIHDWCPPYAVLARWLVKIPEFKQMIDEALKHRAMLHFEEIIETADEQYEKFKDDDDAGVQAAKLKIDSRKFLAEKGDADRFGTKTKATGDVAVQIVIDTGIRREEKDVTPQPQQIEAQDAE